MTPAAWVALALYLTAPPVVAACLYLVARRRVLRLEEAYRLVITHAGSDLRRALVDVQLAEAEAQVGALPVVEWGNLEGPPVRPLDGPLHVATPGTVPVAPGPDVLALLDPFS